MATEKKEKVQRMKGVSVDKAIVYGNLAIPLGRKAEEGKTHKWIAFVRGVHNEDISYFIKKVIFVLHPSFANPKRVVERFPFEIHESGWGEFEITIKVFFQDPAEKCVDLFHPLKLYPAPNDVSVLSSIHGPNSWKKPVIAFESYEEIVFNQPREEFYKILTENNPANLPPKPHNLLVTQFNEKAELKKIEDAKLKIRKELQLLREKYDKLEAESKLLVDDISKLETNDIVAAMDEEEVLPLEDPLDGLDWTT